jgi:cell division protein FtsB
VTAVARRGSAAKRPRPRLERDRPRLTGRAAGLLVAVSVLVMMALVPARQLLEQQGRIAELNRHALALEAQNADLREEVAALNDPVHLEELARACLGMVAPRETAFVIPGKPAAADC